MKQYLFGALAALIAIAFIHPAVRAQSFDSLDIQSTQAVAFLKTDRTILYIKRPGMPVDAYDIAAIDAANGDLRVPLDSIRNLAIIGMTPQGNRIIAGATVGYLDNNSIHQVFKGLLSIPWPMTNESLNLQPIVFLRAASQNANFRPAGVLSADGTQWWAVTSTNGSVPLIFYHGRTDGTGSIDSAVVTADVAGLGAPLQGGFHMSNIVVDKNTNWMFATSFDGLDAQGTSGRALFYKWISSNGQGGLSATNFTGAVITGSSIKNAFDSLYGLTVQPAPHFAGTFVYVGMTPTSDNSIDFYPINITGGISFPASSDYQISRSVLPDNENFFAGPNCGSYTEDIIGVGAGQCGNSGDVNFSVTADTAVFISHESPYNCANRNSASAIWMYNVSTQPQSPATLVYNDSGAVELQPVFVPAADTIPHFPGITQDATQKDFGSIDTAKSVSKTITITDTSIFAGTYIDSAKISGLNASEFTITSPTFSYTLNRKASVPVSITFVPVDSAGPRTATLTIYSSMSTDPILSVNLTGTAKVQQSGVLDDPALAANIEIDPNPFSAQTSVRLTAQEAGTLGIIVHDALGRTVYSSDVRRAGAGATETFTFDANSLGLASGVYVVTGLFGVRSASREVVLTK